MNATRCGAAPDQANAGRPNWRRIFRSSSRALRTGPTAFGRWEENTAMNRVRPPSTGITYTRSADRSPVCGRASTMLSIFTASTGLSERTRSPVNGEYNTGLTCFGGTRSGSGRGRDAGTSCGLACASPPERATMRVIVSASRAAPAAGKPTLKSTRRSLVILGLPPGSLLVARSAVYLFPPVRMVCGRRRGTRRFQDAPPGSQTGGPRELVSLGRRGGQDHPDLTGGERHALAGRQG